MIDERLEEMASLHVVGALSEAEAREFKKTMQANPELRDFVARLSTVTGALAGAVPAVQPPPALRAKVLGQIASSQNVVPLPAPDAGRLSWLPWALAAGLAILCSVQFSQESRLRKTMGDQAQQLGAMDQLAQTLEASTNNLQKTVMALQEKNRLAGLRVALLNSLVAKSPKTMAVTLWDDERQDGIFVAQNLKALPTDKDYELWVIDETQKPVAAGVFHVEANGSIRMEFKPSRLIKTAGKFAVTEEIKGGVESPTLKNLVLASN